MGVNFDLKDFTDFKDSLIKLSQSGNIQAFNKKVVENMASVYVRYQSILSVFFHVA